MDTLGTSSGDGKGRASTAGTTPAVAACAVTKRFPGVVANDQVSFEGLPGEIHALLGENGAGKTTLCNVITGLYHPDEGGIELGGEPATFGSPRDAHEAGIFMVHQHFRLVPSLSVADNVVLGWSRGGGLWHSPRKVRREVAHLAEQYHMSIDPHARIWQLSVGEQQRVEILKALYRGARILILDEPTTVLTPQEVDHLFASLRRMAKGGATVIFISHKLPEVLGVSDRVTVLRAGKAVGTVETARTDAASLAHMMVGRRLLLARKTESASDGDGGEGSRSVVLELSGVGAKSNLGTPALRDVSLELRAGEILGVAGVAGNGQRELAEVIAGLRPRTGGTVSIAGHPQRGVPWEAIESGLAYVPEERMGVGVAPGLTVADNLILKSYREKGQGPILRAKRVFARATELMTRFDVVARGPRTVTRQLSGGNVQRVLLARELSGHAQVLVAASPTRGLDVAATESVRQVLLDSARNGVGVLLISEDLDEILDLSDRIAVMYAGRIVDVVDADDADIERLGLAMSGARAAAGAEP